MNLARLKILPAAARRPSYSSQAGFPYAERGLLRDKRALVGLSELGYMTTSRVKAGDEVVAGFNRGPSEKLPG